MYDFNHDGKIDHRDQAFNYYVYRNTISDENANSTRHNKSTNSTGSSKMGLVIWLIIIVLCGVIQGLH